jgi:hypothetical protein
MRLPRGIARFNRVLTNPIQGTWAWLLPPWVVIVHRGRRSGRVYRTPVIGVVRSGRLRAWVLYGEQSDWVLNLIAGGGRVVRAGRTYELGEASVVVGGPSGKVLVASLGT